jgi:hypothetical protein
MGIHSGCGVNFLQTKLLRGACKSPERGLCAVDSRNATETVSSNSRHCYYCTCYIKSELYMFKSPKQSRARSESGGHWTISQSSASQSSAKPTPQRPIAHGPGLNQKAQKIGQRTIITSDNETRRGRQWPGGVVFRRRGRLPMNPASLR